MNRAFMHTYMLMGFIMGWFLRSLRPSDSADSVGSLTLFVVAFFIWAIMGWLDSYRQRIGFNNWTTIRAQGKWRFVLVHHLFYRGVVLAVVVFIIPYMVVGFTKPLLVALVPAMLLLLATLTYLGLAEWKSNEVESLRQRTTVAGNQG